MKKGEKVSGDMSGNAFYPQGKNFKGPAKSVHSPSNLFDTLPVPGGEDDACKQLRSQGKTGVKGS